MPNSTRAWLYVRGTRSIRIVMDKGSLAIHGPGPLVRRQQFPDSVGATLEHTQLEQQLVVEGWSLEQMVTERRSGHDRRAVSRGPDRRNGLRLV